MEDEKRLFYEKLDEYESKLPQKYDREKFVLSSEKYNLILECLNTEKGIKAPGGARFKNWEKAIFRKTTIGEKEVLICLNTECPVVTRDEVFEVISKCHIQACQESKNVCGDTPLLKSICNCASMCNTLRCSCRKANLQCSTRCHTNNRKCENK
jgi:hypothetical protein